MSRIKKFILWITGILGFLFILLVILLLLLPFLVNLEPLKHRLIAYISKEIGGEAQFDKVAIALLPHPQVFIQGTKIAIPDKITVAMEGLSIVPQIIPLLGGKVQIDSLLAEAPAVTMEIPAQKSEKEGPPGFSPRMIADALRPLLGLMESKAPRLTILVEKGQLTLTKAHQPFYWFRDIQGRAHLPPDQLQVDLTCKSNLWTHISIAARLSSKDLSGTGNIEAEDIQTQVLLSSFAPGVFPAAERPGDQLKISLELDQGRALRGKIQASSPSLTFQRGEKKWGVSGVTINGAFQTEGEKITLSVSELFLESPRARLSGELNIDLAAPRFRLALVGRGMEVSPVREIALGLAGETEPVRTIFDILREGEIPHISLETHGRSLADLNRLENILIQGRIVGGRIFLSESLIGLPGIHFDLTQARGNVRLAHGILEGKDLAARWEKTRASRGSLKLGLEGGDAPFHLEALADVDLAQLPPFLKKLIGNQTFSHEMDRFQEWRGTGRAKLILGDSLESIQPKVEVEGLRLYTRYERIPYPLKIVGARGGYDGREIEVKDLAGTIGQSSFSDFSGRINLGETPDILVTGGKSSIALEEIYAWLKSMETFKGPLQEIRSLKGIVTLSSLNLKGPLTQPEKWDYRFDGQIQKLALEASILPSPLALPAAKFEVTPEKILLQNAQVNLSDVSLKGSAAFQDWQKGLSSVEGTFQGNVGPKGTGWASDRFQLPPNLRIRAPLTVSQAHLGWSRKDGISFSGNWRWPGGPDASVDLVYSPEGLTVNRLLITDEDSRADIGLKWQQKELQLDFKGNLQKTTVDRILVKNAFLAGSLHGDFRSHFFIDAPMRSTAHGKLAGDGLDLAPVTKLPLILKSFSLDAGKNTIRVQSAALSWEDRRVTLEGSVDFSAEAFLVDMDVVADGIQWEKIKKILKNEHSKIEAPRSGKRNFPPLRGRVRFKTSYFEYEKFTWRPLHLEAAFLPDGVTVTVTEAKICGILTPGTVRITSEGIALNFHPLVENREFSTCLECLFGKTWTLSGNLNFSGQIRGQGQPQDLIRSLQGPLELDLKDGSVYRESFLPKILAFLNLADLFERGQRDQSKGGMSYKEIRAKGELNSGKVLLKELHMDASAMQLFSQGEIDFVNQKIDVMVAVAPLKTVDWIVQRIPIVRYILEGTLVSIPVRVYGDLKDPKIFPLDPSLIGSGLLGIMKRTLKVPFKLVQPLLKDIEKPGQQPPGDPKKN
jgi:hypothetical protein